MAIVPLWTPENTTVLSSVFTVHPGKVVVLWAVGFNKYKFRVENEVATPMQACLHRLIHDFSGSRLPSTKDTAQDCCGWIVDVNHVSSELMADIAVSTMNCLVACRFAHVWLLGFPVPTSLNSTMPLWSALLMSMLTCMTLDKCTHRKFL